MIMTNDFVKVFFMKYYSEQQTAKKRRCVTRIRTVLVLLCLSALAARLYLMLHVTTGNAARSFWFCLILFTLSGRIVITLREVLLLSLKRVIAHEEGILKKRGSTRSIFRHAYENGAVVHPPLLHHAHEAHPHFGGRRKREPVGRAEPHEAPARGRNAGEAIRRAGLCHGGAA